jgi:hypothetical protein
MTIIVPVAMTIIVPVAMTIIVPIARWHICIPKNRKFGTFLRAWNGKFCYTYFVAIWYCEAI